MKQIAFPGARPTLAAIALLFCMASLRADQQEPAPSVYQDKKHGVSLKYPAGWKTKADSDYDLRLVPAAGDDQRAITFDAPDIPSIPLFGIPMGMVESHYIDDLRSKHPGLVVDGAADYSLAGAKKARLVRLSWKRDGTPHSSASLLIVHGNNVFILCADSDAKDWPATRADFDKIAGSIMWGK